ncbi:phosphatase PAP2 family protein [Actinotalea sp.]|uniref:phosphatase PAP2 family protein n=1 Tax=Actinotalea sp. TaxID=1872145 RepID=UPI0035652922
MPSPTRRERLGALLAAVRRQADLLRADSSRVARAVGLGLLVAGVAAFLGVLDAVREMDDLASLDTPVLEWLAAARSPVVTAVLTAVTTVFGPVVLPVLVGLGGLGWGLWRKEWWPVLLLLGAMLGSSAVAFTLKLVIARPRPALDSQLVPGLESTYSFPSGHTAGAATLALVVAYLLWIRRPTPRSLVLWCVAAGVTVGVVALSRLYLGYHFVTDVAASVALGVAVLGAVVLIDGRHGGARRTSR